MNDTRRSAVLYAHDPNTPGVSIVREILREHGWKITISDIPPADTTSFYIMTKDGPIDSIEGVQELVGIRRQP